ncbi:LuxR family transcriptional regulator [Tritonibacter scottomollicae]|uniref:LuxR family transcriptional regulator n=1 Tax=Tritonibacter scottomollicae TaxID=483013 RepID=UPI003AA8C97D
MYAYLAEDFASELINVRSDSELDDALKQVSRRLGFDHFALSLEMRSTTRDAPGLLLHDYPDEWAKVYIAFDLAGKDPVRRACDKTVIGFAWDWIDELVPLTRGDRQMLAVGRGCGIGNGYTVPRHLPGVGRGTCTFAVGPDQELPRPHFAIAEIVGTLALSCALGLSSEKSDGTVPVLSDRQRECLLWVARGKTAAETAMILEISTETVIQHLKMARERYQVHCKQSLVVAALFDGLIGFADIIRWRDTG